MGNAICSPTTSKCCSCNLVTYIANRSLRRRTKPRIIRVYNLRPHIHTLSSVTPLSVDMIHTRTLQWYPRPRTNNYNNWSSKSRSPVASEQEGFIQYRKTTKGRTSVHNELLNINNNGVSPPTIPDHQNSSLRVSILQLWIHAYIHTYILSDANLCSDTKP